MKGLEDMIGKALKNVMANMVNNSGATEFVNQITTQVVARFDQIDTKLDLILQAQETIANRLTELETPCCQTTTEAETPLKLLSHQ